MQTIEVVPATSDLWLEYFGDLPDSRVRAFVALLDGVPVGIAGIANRGTVLEVFSDIKPELRPYKLTIAKVARKIRGILQSTAKPAFAFASPDEPTADRFLRWIGFEQSDDRGLYQWHRS